MDKLKCTWTKTKGIVVLKLHGPFSLTDVPEFDEQMEGVLAEKPARVVVDMSDLNTISSAGLGSLLKLRLRSQQEQCEVTLTGLQPRVLEVIKSARLDQLFGTRDA